MGENSRDGRGAKYTESVFETRLVARLQSGESEAMNTLFELHVDRVYAYSRHLLGNREDAEEVTSEAFVRAFERVGAYRGDGSFRGWLFAIVRNLCRDRQSQPRLQLLDADFMEQQHDRGRQQEQVETRAVVQQAMLQLPEEQRMTLTLCDVEQWDAREVAAILDRSLPATKSLLYRARRALRTALTEIWKEEENRNEV